MLDQFFPPGSQKTLLPSIKSCSFLCLYLSVACKELTWQCPFYFQAQGHVLFSALFNTHYLLPPWLHSSFSYFLLHIRRTLLNIWTGFLLFVLFHESPIVSHCISSSTRVVVFLPVLRLSVLPATSCLWCSVTWVLPMNWVQMSPTGRPWGSPFLGLEKLFAKFSPFQRIYCFLEISSGHQLTPEIDPQGVQDSWWVKNLVIEFFLVTLFSYFCFYVTGKSYFLEKRNRKSDICPYYTKKIHK